MFLLIAGCSSTPQSLQLQTVRPDIPAKFELSKTAFYPQLEFHCGPAALATVAQSRGVDISPQEIAQQIYIPGLQGSFQAEIIASARNLELLPVELDGKLSSIFVEVAMGTPILVMQNLSLESYPQWHYAVVIGYDLDAQQIILRSGEEKRLIRSFELFERTWQRANYWSLAIVEPGYVPATVTFRQFIAPLIDFEQLGQIPLAYEGYLAAIKRWPENTTAVIAAGNAAYSMGNFIEAKNHYSEGLSIEPENTSIMNNLAYTEFQLGDRVRALKLIQQARQLDPENQNLRDSEVEISNWGQ